MKAYALHGINDIRLEQVENPKPKEDEVIVAVKAVGVCGSDIPRIYQAGTYTFPLIPGHEFSGVVTELGSSANSDWMGKKVGVYPLVPCYSCLPCQRKQYEMCRHYSYLGSRRDGAFAEYVAVPEDNLIELPAGVSFEAAAMLEPMSVAVHAMRSVSPEQEQTVAVYGLGTIGLLLCMFLKEAGLEKILVIGNKRFQRERIAELGISPENCCDGRIQNVDGWISEKTDGAGVDVFFECVGKNETIKQAISNSAPGGSVQLVGNPASDIGLEKNIYWKILRNQLTVKGSWNSGFCHAKEDDWHYALQRLESGSAHPEQFITQKLSMDQLEQGLHIMRDKTEEYVKVMMII